MRNRWKRTTAILLSISMLAILFDCTGQQKAYASEPFVLSSLDGMEISTGEDAPFFTITGGEEGIDYDYSNGVLTVLSDKPLSVEGKKGEVSKHRIVLGDAENNQDICVTIKDITIDLSKEVSSNAAIEIPDDYKGNVTLTIEGENRIKSVSHCAGIQKNGDIDSGILTLNGEGAIFVNGGYGGAGIGSTDEKDCNNIVIESGTIESQGGFNGAGIGSGEKGDVGNLIIQGGNVKATGYFEAAGIGGGAFGIVDSIVIDGGTIMAKGGGNCGNGIGAGAHKQCKHITINDGLIYAEGGYIEKSKTWGTGIGSSLYEAGNSIHINGGEVHAAGYGEKGYAIGGWFQSENENSASESGIHITGGTVFTETTNGKTDILAKNAGVYIRGGSVRTSKIISNTSSNVIRNAPTAMKEIDPNEEVFLHTISGYPASTLLSLEDPIPGAAYFNSKKMKTDENGMLYLYLPKASVSEMKIPPKANYGYQVEFVTNCEEIIPSQSILPGDVVARPNDPQKEGYVFEGWYLTDSNQKDKDKWDFVHDKVSGNMILYAGWELKSVSGNEPGDTPSDPSVSNPSTPSENKPSPDPGAPDPTTSDPNAPEPVTPSPTPSGPDAPEKKEETDPVKQPISQNETAFKNIAVTVKGEKNGNPARYTYSGLAIRPTVSIQYRTVVNGKVKKKKLKENIDYTVSYHHNLEANDASAQSNSDVKTDLPYVEIRGLSDYDGVYRRNFIIEKRAFSKVKLQPLADITSTTKDMSLSSNTLADIIAAGVQVQDGDRVLEPSEYEVVFYRDKKCKTEIAKEDVTGDLEKDNTYYVKVRSNGNGNYSAGFNKKAQSVTVFSARTIEEKIEMIDLSKCIVTIKENSQRRPYEYNGKAIKPKVTVQDPTGYVLKKNQYKVVYKNNVNAGNKDSSEAPCIIIKGKGKTYGSIETYFDIEKTSLSNVKVKKLSSFVYSGKDESKSIRPVVTDKKGYLEQDVDFSIAVKQSDSNWLFGKTAELSLTALDSSKNYTAGTQKENVTVKLIQRSLSNIFAVRILVTAKQGYTNEEITKGVVPKISVSYNNTALKCSEKSTLEEMKNDTDADYYVIVKKNNKVGNGQVQIIGINKYKGKVKVKFRIRKV